LYRDKHNDILSSKNDKIAGNLPVCLCVTITVLI